MVGANLGLGKFELGQIWVWANLDWGKLGYGQIWGWANMAGQIWSGQTWFGQKWDVIAFSKHVDHGHGDLPTYNK